MGRETETGRRTQRAGRHIWGERQIGEEMVMEMGRETETGRKRHRGEKTEMRRETDTGGEGDKERKMEMWRSVSKLVGTIVGLIEEACRKIDKKNYIFSFCFTKTVSCQWEKLEFSFVVAVL
jgi:hypothetical protein